MKKYIALLRGVNVGGKNKVPMPLLKAALEDAGLFAVSTYINSGNVTFDADTDDLVALQQSVRQAIAGQFRLDIPVPVIPSDDLAQALAPAPAWWGEDKDAKHNALVLLAPASPPQVIEAAGATMPAL